MVEQMQPVYEQNVGHSKYSLGAKKYTYAVMNTEYYVSFVVKNIITYNIYHNQIESVRKKQSERDQNW